MGGRFAVFYPSVSGDEVAGGGSLLPGDPGTEARTLMGEGGALQIAALFVVTGGAYSNLPGVDPWDEARDARLYPGPHPVVAHPPCARWSVPLAFVNQTRYGYKVGDDGGCFASALKSVRTYGGVLEHPAETKAWPAYDLPRPPRNGWGQALGDYGWVTEVDQHTYGHPARKRTWLYYVGPEPSALNWRRAPVGQTALVSWLGYGKRDPRDLEGRRRLTRREALGTPEAFREALIAMARSVLVPPSQVAA